MDKAKSANETIHTANMGKESAPLKVSGGLEGIGGASDDDSAREEAEIRLHYGPKRDAATPDSIDEDERIDATILHDEGKRRSQGRYWADPEDQIQCHKCKGKGHIAFNCPFLFCTKCGSNEHEPRNCPQSLHCYNCGDLGHYSVTCPKPKKAQVACETCHSRTHPTHACPRIWRCYIPNRDYQSPNSLQPFCYCCASDQHYGDDCPIAGRGNREPSAFCEANAPVLPRSRMSYQQRGRESRDQDGGQGPGQPRLPHSGQSMSIADSMRASARYNNDDRRINHHQRTNNRDQRKASEIGRGSDSDWYDYRQRGPPRSRRRSRSPRLHFYTH